MELCENKIFCTAKETISRVNTAHIMEKIFRQGANIHELQRHLEIKYQENKTNNR